MKPAPSSLSLAIRQGIGHIHQAFKAKLAGYLAAVPTRTTTQAGRYNTNPNASTAQFQRVQMMWDGEAIVKSSDFGSNYVQKRRMYCTNGMTYSPDTGDSALDEELSAYLKETWKKMGINCSMQDAFSRTADVELPMRGDSALVWVRDMTQLRLMEVQSDRIGEIFQYWSNYEVIDGLNYFAGIYTYPTNHPQTPGQYAAFRCYERIDQWYGNPQVYPASDVMFFKDDLMAGIRGVTKFAQCLPIVGNRDTILYATMQTMAQQSKIAAIASNNAGESDELSYDTETLPNGTVQYIERVGDGPVVRYQFNGDSYQVLKAEHPTTSFQLAMDKLDMKAALAIGFPYEFLFSPSESGGAPSRFSFEIAGKEIERLRDNIYRPRLDIISYVTIMDAIERKIFPAYPNNTRGMWNFGTLPSADAFRDVKSDISSIRAGTATRDMITTANTGRPFAAILRQSTQEAIAISMAVAEANKKLPKGAPPVTKDDIAQTSDNPRNDALAQQIDSGKTSIPNQSPSKKAKLEAATDGEWKTINGRHIFIKNGQSVEDALKSNGEPRGQKMYMASKGDYKTLPNGPFYLASEEDYAKNYGSNIHEIHADPKSTLDLTHIEADAEDGAQQLKQSLQDKGIDISGIKFGKEDELAQSLNSNLKELSSRIKDAGYDSVSLNEYVYGGGKDQTMLVLDKEIITGHKPPSAKLAAYMGDVTIGDLPEATRADIAKILGTNGATDSLRAVKFGMVAPELETMADPHNLASAQKNIRYRTNGDCADEVHANDEKHILVNNGRIIDGHHHLAKALKGKVSKSLAVIDLTPTRFQTAKLNFNPSQARDQEGKWTAGDVKGYHEAQDDEELSGSQSAVDRSEEIANDKSPIVSVSDHEDAIDAHKEAARDHRFAAKHLPKDAPSELTQYHMDESSRHLVEASNLGPRKKAAEAAEVAVSDSQEASALSQKATDEDYPEQHEEAAEAHESATKSHSKAAKGFAGINDEKSAYHAAESDKHSRQAAHHDAEIKASKRRQAEEAASETFTTKGEKWNAEDVRRYDRHLQHKTNKIEATGTDEEYNQASERLSEADASTWAALKSEDANATPDEWFMQTPGAHERLASDHDKARIAHEKAASISRANESPQGLVEFHERAIAEHAQKAKEFRRA